MDVTETTNTQSIVVFGAGPGSGRAVAHRYARAGYRVVLVARRADPLHRFAAELAAGGATAHVLTGDLSDTGAIPALATRIRAAVGDPTVLYYAPAPADPGFRPAAELGPEELRELMPKTVDTLVALVREFLPAMLARGRGAVLSVQGAAAIHGWPNLSGWPILLAAQRHYLQSLAAEVADRGVYVGQLFVGTRIPGSAANAEFLAALPPDSPLPDKPPAEPDELAELLWTMHGNASPAEASMPDDLLDATHPPT